jgi:hypothetical protein
MYENGIMFDIECLTTCNVSRKTCKFDKYLTHFTKKYLNKTKNGISILARSNSRSPIRMKNSQHNRSCSNEKSNCQKKLNRNFNLEENATTWSVNDDYPSMTEINKNVETDAYHSKKLNRHISMIELSNEKSISNSSHNICHKIELNNQLFHDISLNDSIMYCTSSDNKSNGILFTPQQLDLSSGLFSKIFYQYVETCFKIQGLFENANKSKFNWKPTESQDHEIIEQGILFKLILSSESINAGNKITVLKDNSKMRQANFWVIGRRKIKRSKLGIDSGNSTESKAIRSYEDFFVCFFDTLDNILIELAFDVGFC